MNKNFLWFFSTIEFHEAEEAKQLFVILTCLKEINEPRIYGDFICK
jgi:hypothetical protein